MLSKLRDVKSHQVYTSLWIAFVDTKSGKVQKQNCCNKTDVFFKSITNDEIWAYIKSGEPFGKAGGYGIQGGAATFIERIEGDFYSVWGLPLCDFCTVMKKMLNEHSER